MRRLATLFAVLALCLFGAACGGDEEAPVTPLDDALGYFAKGSPFVAAIETDPEHPQVKEAVALVNRFRGAGLLVQRLEELTRLRFLRYDRDIRPLLGEPLVVGLVRPAAGSGLATPLVAALRVPNSNKAKQVVLRRPGFVARGKASGVRIYGNEPEERYLAVDGDVLLAATNRDFLRQAIEMRRSDNRMREAAFDADLKGLPGGTFARVSADPRAFIGVDPALRPALDVKWLSSMRRLAATLSATGTGVGLDLRLRTDRGSLEDADLPFAPKPGPLPLLGGKGDVKAGLREPARLARFVGDVWNKVAPRRARRLREAAAGRIDWKRILRHMEDRAVVATDPFSRRFAARIEINEPADVRDGLATLAPALPDALAALGRPGLGLATPEQGENFYALATPRGGTAVFGVVGEALVAASEADRAAGLASEATTTAPGPPAAAVFTLDAGEIAGNALGRILEGPAAIAVPFVVAPLEDLTGSLTIDRNGLRARAKLTIAK